MSVEETMAAPELLGAGMEAEPNSEAWWHARNFDELRLIMDRGPALGASFDGATAEVERRARERLRDEERAAVTKDARNRRMRRLTLEGLSLGCLLMLLAIALTR